ncbi:MAG: aspartate/glutamate racemase family protein [Rubrimonas sp.]|uniref:aspartate/glutamate racemase family protein n=1 Tax=Rubrimonas sp. TaxID=2036015 RepID=UPI002FDE2E45
MTRLLLVNPNMTCEMTDRLAAVARRAASAGTEIVPLTATRGFPYISSRAESLIAGTIALEMIAEHREGADAVVIAAYGDPGLRAARELFDIPVVGMAEAAMLTSCMLGETFGLVTFTPRMTPWYRDNVVEAGLTGRFVGMRTPPEAVGPVTLVAQTMRDMLLALARESALEDGADVVILGGAPLAGLAETFAEDCPAVLVDPVSAAVRQAETLAKLAPRGAHRGRFARPPGKPSEGLHPALARLIAEGAAA